jgi:hypothetical protein
MRFVLAWLGLALVLLGLAAWQESNAGPDISILAGFIAVIGAWVVSHRAKKRAKKLRPCPACGREIRLEAFSCPLCGHPLGWSEWTDRAATGLLGLGRLGTVFIVTPLLGMLWLLRGCE